MKIKIIKLSVALTVYGLCMSVLLASVHAKDIVSYGKATLLSGAAAISLTDVGAKALSNLHNHVDNTSFNHFIQVIERRNLAREREDARDEILKKHQTLIDKLLAAWRLLAASMTIKLSFKYF